MFDISNYVHLNFEDVRESDTDYHVCCPFCIEDSKYHMAISKNKQVAHCFKCGWGGSWISFVMQNSNLSYAFALAEIYKRPRASLDVYKELSGSESKTLPDKRLSWIPNDFIRVSSDMESTQLAKKYLRRRGFTSEDLWDRYDLGICPLTHPYRLIIPIEHGYYQARALLKWMSPKYINPAVDARDYIFNSNALELYDEVVILEGAFSAMAVGENAIALIGKEPVREKVDRLIESNVKHFCVALDYGAEKWSVELSEILSRNGKEVSVWDFKDSRDPADGGMHEDLPYDDLRTKLYFRMKQV